METSQKRKITYTLTFDPKEAYALKCLLQNPLNPPNDDFDEIRIKLWDALPSFQELGEAME